MELSAEIRVALGLSGVYPLFRECRKIIGVPQSDYLWCSDEDLRVVKLVLSAVAMVRQATEYGLR